MRAVLSKGFIPAGNIPALGVQAIALVTDIVRVTPGWKLKILQAGAFVQGADAVELYAASLTLNAFLDPAGTVLAGQIILAGSGSRQGGGSPLGIATAMSICPLELDNEVQFQAEPTVSGSVGGAMGAFTVQFSGELKNTDAVNPQGWLANMFVLYELYLAKGSIGADP